MGFVWKTPEEINLALTRLCVALNCVDEIRNLFTQVEYASIAEMLHEGTLDGRLPA